jgi:hypothetical protein
MLTDLLVKGKVSHDFVRLLIDLTKYIGVMLSSRIAFYCFDCITVNLVFYPTARRLRIMFVQFLSFSPCFVFVLFVSSCLVLVESSFLNYFVSVFNASF